MLPDGPTRTFIPIITLTKHPQQLDSTSASEKGAGAPEITSAMIAAGLEVFWRHEAGGDDPAMTVREIFVAMAEMQQRPPR